MYLFDFNKAFQVLQSFALNYAVINLMRTPNTVNFVAFYIFDIEVPKIMRSLLLESPRVV